MAVRTGWIRASSLPFAFEQRLLPCHAPAIAGQLAVGPHDTVTRNRDGDGIGRARAADRAARPGGSDGSRPLAVVSRLAERNPRKRLPALPLECGRLDIQRQL